MDINIKFVVMPFAVAQHVKSI